MVPDINNEHAVETYRSLIQIATEGLKVLLLLNGGAAVAILAYLGSISANVTTVPDMRIPMGCYIAGLLLCGLAFATTYLTQFVRFNELVHAGDGNKIGGHMLWLRLTFLLAFLSIVSFAIGSFYAVTLFR